MRVQVDGLLPLITSTVIEYSNGDEVIAKLVYERLEKHCSKCFRLDHEIKDCLEAKAQERARKAAQESESIMQKSFNSADDDRKMEQRSTAYKFSATAGGGDYERRPPKEHKETSFRRPYKDQPKVWQERGEQRRAYHSREYSRYANERANRPPRDHNYQRSNVVSQNRSYYREIPKEIPDKDTGSSSAKRNTAPPDRGVPHQDCLPPVPQEAFDEAMGELRNVMLQYTKNADPTESEARKERMRQAEAEGEMVETAIQMARTSQAIINERQRREQISNTPERTPASQRLGSRTPAHTNNDVGIDIPASNSQERIPATQRLGPPLIALTTNRDDAIESLQEEEEDRVPAALRLGPLVQSPPKETNGTSGEKKKRGRPPGQKLNQESQKVIVGSGSRSRRLEAALTNPVNDSMLIQQINDDLNAAYQAEEEYWRQRSRLLWLQLGDRNTGYFHAISKNRKRANAFSVIEDSEGMMVYKEDEIAKFLRGHGKNGNLSWMAWNLVGKRSVKNKLGVGRWKWMLYQCVERTVA
ncbi:hypothetical protein Bca52824_028966 [Brassica carinata]|uniref:Zinc knuckle CX2CX4HX4C domain-containing protein n=1 Tax=Brassica carinata TaxID=52824 RepID=A0A8X8AR00_BRACI|nr:hypothetical protein Bca52824_028966 [Brassica carinata]